MKMTLGKKLAPGFVALILVTFLLGVQNAVKEKSIPTQAVAQPATVTIHSVDAFDQVQLGMGGAKVSPEISPRLDIRNMTIDAHQPEPEALKNDEQYPGLAKLAPELNDFEHAAQISRIAHIN